MGLGVFGGGSGVTRFLCARGAEVTVTDLLDREALAGSVEALSDLPVCWRLGEHREEDLLGADMVVVNPAIPRTAKLVERCRTAGVRLETEMNLFLKLCPAPIVGITGSNGKTTTSSLLAAMASTEEPRVWLGGNLGRSLLPVIDEIDPNHRVVLELSSFQLEDARAIDRRPDISVVVNLSPNHLDRHGSYESYLEAKQEILRDGPSPNLAVRNVDDADCALWAERTTRSVVAVSVDRRKLPGGGIHADLAAGVVTVVDAQGAGETLFRREDLRLVGDFNVSNAALAGAAALGMGVSYDAIAAGVRAFEGVRHRLELLASVNGVRYYNDSIATTPESTIAALEALGPDVILICGGASKGASYDELGATARRRARAVIVLGTTAEEIAAAIGHADGGPEIAPAEDLPAALGVARRLARPGDRVVLSPACASYDQFRNFQERGELFRHLVEKIETV